jgi:hypothetical protein
MARLDGFEERWGREAAAVGRAMKAWRQAHPRATFAEIEAAVDARLNGARARLLEELALASAAADQAGQPAEGRARCPGCGARLAPRGAHERAVRTQGDEAVRLRRDYAVCPSCGAGLFPPG